MYIEIKRKYSDTLEKALTSFSSRLVNENNSSNDLTNKLDELTCKELLSKLNGSKLIKVVDIELTTVIAATKHFLTSNTSEEELKDCRYLFVKFGKNYPPPNSKKKRCHGENGRVYIKDAAITFAKQIEEELKNRKPF